MDGNSNIIGTWGYRSGVSGTVTPPQGARMLSVAAYSSAGGTLTINGGNTITIPAGVMFNLAFDPDLVIRPTFVFTGTASYYTDFVT